MGTYVGKPILYKVSNQHFHTLLQVALTFIALRLIWGFFCSSLMVCQFVVAHITVEFDLRIFLIVVIEGY